MTKPMLGVIAVLVGCGGGKKMGTEETLAVKAKAPPEVVQRARDCDKSPKQGCGRLAGQYLMGQTVPKDTARARMLAEKACGAGDQIGCFNLGYMYSHGVEMKQDFAKAGELYQGACGAGIMDACYNIGEFEELGQGREQSLERAMAQYKTVCDHGEQWGCVPLARLLKPSDEAAARAMADKACKAGEKDGCKLIEEWDGGGTGVNAP